MLFYCPLSKILPTSSVRILSESKNVYRKEELDETRRLQHTERKMDCLDPETAVRKILYEFGIFRRSRVLYFSLQHPMDVVIKRLKHTMDVSDVFRPNDFSLRGGGAMAAAQLIGGECNEPNNPIK